MRVLLVFAKRALPRTCVTAAGRSPPPPPPPAPADCPRGTPPDPQRHPTIRGPPPGLAHTHTPWRETRPPTRPTWRPCCGGCRRVRKGSQAEEREEGGNRQAPCRVHTAARARRAPSSPPGRCARPREERPTHRRAYPGRARGRKGAAQARQPPPFYAAEKMTRKKKFARFFSLLVRLRAADGPRPAAPRRRIGPPGDGTRWERTCQGASSA